MERQTCNSAIRIQWEIRNLKELKKTADSVCLGLFMGHTEKLNTIKTQNPIPPGMYNGTLLSDKNLGIRSFVTTRKGSKLQHYIGVQLDI